MEIRELERLTEELLKMHQQLRSENDPNTRHQMLERVFDIIGRIEAAEKMKGYLGA
ncbi:MAG: hypothetical protein KDD25_00445 [Bdellovibrionales bacterium]|nr:hypothetical protein [Bdellovibrionales bacterium]